MRPQDVLQLLTSVGAILTDSHFVYTSGKHGSTYINKDALYPHTAETSRLCRTLATQFAGSGVEVVIAPAIGGVILSQWTAYHLSEIFNREVLGVYAEKHKTEDRFVIQREYDKLVIGKKILVVEDILNTGGSAEKVIAATRSVGGRVIGLGALCNRGGVEPKDVGDPPRLVALLNMKFQAWNEAECPLCARGVPINTDVGKGREFLARKSA